jgi:hypothetical protein
VALTGKVVGFGLFDSLAILGKDRCLARIDRTLLEMQNANRSMQNEIDNRQTTTDN